ncbi:hypothetical protein JCM10213_004076 [Rhodosporidiobolus nylandii]
MADSASTSSSALPAAGSSSETSAAASTSATPAAAAPAADDHLARGIRALALKKWSDACDELAQAVEASTEKYGDLAPENVEALVLYGKALLNSAIAQSAVLGGGAPTGEVPEAGPSGASSSNAAAGSSTASPSNAAFHFGGDAEDEEEEEEGGEGEEEEGAPGADREDDLESAFQVLDLARTIVSKTVEEVETALAEDEKEPKGKKEDLSEERRKRKERLADVHRLLGDVATESEQFDSAVTEYTSALASLSSILPPYDRALSELHMLIALALDFVPNATERAVKHAMQAKEVLQLKLEQLRGVAEKDEKVKKEIEDIEGLMGDVDMKIEDLRTVPTAPAPTASDSALEALLRDSMSAVANATASGTVNDLTGLVKKKKKPAAAPVAAAEAASEEDPKGKRKAVEAENGEAGEAKKQKTEEA